MCELKSRTNNRLWETAFNKILPFTNRLDKEVAFTTAMGTIGLNQADDVVMNFTFDL